MLEIISRPSSLPKTVWWSGQKQAKLVSEFAARELLLPFSRYWAHLPEVSIRADKDQTCLVIRPSLVDVFLVQACHRVAGMVAFENVTENEPPGHMLARIESGGRPVALCDGIAKMLNCLLSYGLGLETRLVLLKSSDRKFQHIVSEARVGGSWKFLDPTNGFYYFKSGRQLCSASELGSAVTAESVSDWNQRVLPFRSITDSQAGNYVRLFEEVTYGAHISGRESH